MRALFGLGACKTWRRVCAACCLRRRRRLVYRHKSLPSALGREAWGVKCESRSVETQYGVVSSRGSPTGHTQRPNFWERSFSIVRFLEAIDFESRAGYNLFHRVTRSRCLDTRRRRHLGLVGRCVTCRVNDRRHDYGVTANRYGNVSLIIFAPHTSHPPTPPTPTPTF